MPSTPNTSATGGYLRPSTKAPDDDLALDKLLASVVVGITGLPEERVTARMQESTGTQPGQFRVPDAGVNWAAVGVTETTDRGPPAFRRDPSGEGSSILVRHATLELLASFYGPSSNAFAELFRDGLYVAQNREALFHQGISLLRVGEVRRLPEIDNTLRRRRSDLGATLRRKILRTYPVLNLRSAGGEIRVDSRSQPWTTER